MSRITVDGNKLNMILQTFAEEVVCSYCDNFSDCKTKELCPLPYKTCKKELLEFLEVEDNEQ